MQGEAEGVADHYFRILDQYVSINVLFESMPVALALLDREGCHVALNQALASISGLTVKELIGKKVAALSGQSGLNIERDFQAFDAGMGVPDHEVVIDGQVFHSSVKPLRDADGRAIGELVALTDITEIKETEKRLAEANEQLRYLAGHDGLTGVLNVRTYTETAERMAAAARCGGGEASVLFLDLDHFKRINDRYGHNTGDLVLVSVADCIRRTVRSCDVIGRVGGEEFSIFLPETSYREAVTEAERLRASIEALRLSMHGRTVGITASIGVAALSQRHRSAADMQRDADDAMYCAKKAGRNRVFGMEGDTPREVGKP